jgi:uncharacterized protein (DUF924 family)
MHHHTPQAVLDFWFQEIDSALWFKKDADFDQLIADRFGAVLRAAAQAELFAWRSTAQGRLAEVIVLDQFSRNVYRDTPRAFAQDALALGLAQEAVAAGALAQLSEAQRPFLLMPYMHSESAFIHTVAEPLFAAHTSADTYDFELKHKAIIDQYGRYPHRNGILGRESTPEELVFLTQEGSSF